MPRTRVELKVPEDGVSPILRFDSALGVRHRHTPSKLPKIDPRSGRDEGGVRGTESRGGGGEVRADGCERA